MSRRSKAREVAMQILFQEDVNPGVSEETIDLFLKERLQGAADLIEFSKSLVNGVRRNREELDANLSKLADNWTLERMAVTDRNLLRLAAFEMIYTDTPHQVVINEAVELAKRFGAEQSPSFVNGILDRLVKK